MPSSDPVFRPCEVIVILVALGSRKLASWGSYKRLRPEDGRATAAPVHGGRDLSPILLRQIARDVGLTVHEFLAHRR